jgi:hypothetical protein
LDKPKTESSHLDIVPCIPLTRLDAKCERPELRSGWRIPDLLSWARERRSDLLSACLTIVRAWIDAGKPMGNYTLGSYEKWWMPMHFRQTDSLSRSPTVHEVQVESESRAPSLASINKKRREEPRRDRIRLSFSYPVQPWFSFR